MKLANQKVEYVAVELLQLHPDNPRTIKDKQFEILKDSIKDNPEYFEARPILCNRSMVVFAGNMRLRAAIDLGLKEVPVMVMNLSPEKERELMIRDNVQAGDWQMDVLANSFDVAELGSFGIEPELLGVFPKEDEPPATETKSNECDRCKELKDMVLGHEKRSGHKIDFSEPKQ